MTELSIHFTSDEKDETSPINVRLFRSDTGAWTSDVPFTPPLDDPELADLRWYLELFAQWPTGPDYERARRIEADLEGWGRALLESVTPDRESAQVWRDFVRDEGETGDGKLLTIDAIDPRVLRLPWELLADEGGHIFSAGVGVRRRLKKIAGATVKPFDKLRAGSFDLPVQVLLLVSRPDDAGFIPSRAVSLPLLDALDELGDRVATEFLYPPTLKALTDRLRDRQAPPVHVVHFDGHGVYDARMGLGYLLFENEQHQSDRVDANRLGTLLNRCGAPLMVLNACQSAAQEEANPYASVAARLIRAGVGSVLAMNYSVLVVAARKFVAAFYGGLAGGLTVGQAVDEGRYTLMADVERHTITRRDETTGDLVEETIRLSDWFLPALYQQSTDPVVFAPTTPLPPREGLGEGGPGLPLSLTTPTAPGGLPPDPLHGFHGRAREILHLERALAERSVVVLHGFGGMGKTALAAEAGRWFHRTGRFPGGAAFVSFEHGGSLSQLCSWVGQAVSGDPDFVIGGGPPGGSDDPVARVAALLRERPALVILDNFESVLGREPSMPVEELRQVLDAVCKWAARGSRVLITTRDTTFNDARFGPSKQCAHIELGGLATPDALALAAAVLDAHGIDRSAIPRQELVDLMAHLGGHPLSLYLVLPHLRAHTPAELSARFEELLPGFSTGAARERNESLAVSLEFSLRRLGDETRAALPALAVFQSGALESELLAITGMDPELWQAARAELEQAALVTVESVPGVEPPFLRFHPTLLPYLATQLPAQRRAELQERYWQRYYALANYLYETDTQHPHQARAIAQRELPNLHHALDLCIAAASASPPNGGGPRGGKIIAQAVDFADSIAKFLDHFGRWRERDAMMEQVGKFASGKFASGEGLTQAEFMMLSQRGKALRQQGQAAEAEGVFRELLNLLEEGAAYDAAYDHAMTQLRLGISLEERGQHRSSIAFKEKALHEFEMQSSNDSARQMLGNCYHRIANSQLALGEFDEAKENYEKAIAIFQQENAEHSAATSLAQLGTLAMTRGDLAEAAKRYTEALETFRALGEPRMEAVAWHQLGMVAQKQAERVGAQRAAPLWDEAERCYREAVRIREQIRDLPMLATDFNQLAIVAKGAGRLDDAERWYLRAQEVKDQVSPHDASTLNNLANLYLSQGRLGEAARYARRALEIIETLDLSAAPWTTYNILARIAEAQGRPTEAAQWRRKEQESYAAYTGAAHQLPQWAPQFITAVVAAVQGRPEAKQEVEGILPQLEAGGWDNVCHAVQRILAGEHDLDELRTGLDHKDAYIVHTILAQLSGEAPPQTSEVSETSEVSQPEREGITLNDLLALVATACTPAAPPGLGEQLYGATRTMSTDPNAPPELRALGRALNAILSGEREPDLSALPPELAAAVRGVLKEVGG